MSRLVAAATVDSSPAFQSLVVAQTFARNGASHLQPTNAGDRVKPYHYPHFDAFLARGCGRQHKAWGGALAAAPGIWRKYTSSPRSGRQLFVIRHFMIIEIEPMAVARIRGLAR